MSLGSLVSFLVLVTPLTETQVVESAVQPRVLQLESAVSVPTYQQVEFSTLLAQELDDGEALIWYLGHCGWAVRTRTRLLIFDYWEQGAIDGEVSLATGRINPSEIHELDVYVFISHDHGDHYDPTVLEWARSIPNITYVFGWDAGLDPSYVYMSGERARRTFGGMQVSTVNHSFDRIPEVAYLVKVDGLVIYHSGDHASTTEVPNQTFSGNIDYFAGMQDRVDLAFVSTFGRRGGVVVNNGDLYTIERFRPHVVFPMHHGGGEDINQRFADEVVGSVDPTSVMVARRLGDSFSYSDGHARRVP